jgi:hypothetical protein
MPALTRRRSEDHREECWHVYYGDVHVGTIAIRSGSPHHEDPWGWICGFYPGSEPGEYTDGTALSFVKARADFERAWKIFFSKRTEADFQAWREQRDSVLPSVTGTTSAPRMRVLSRLNGWPMRSPVNASPMPSRASAHDSGSMRFATPSS